MQRLLKALLGSFSIALLHDGRASVQHLGFLDLGFGGGADAGLDTADGCDSIPRVVVC